LAYQDSQDQLEEMDCQESEDCLVHQDLRETLARMASRVKLVYQDPKGSKVQKVIWDLLVVEDHVANEEKLDRLDHQAKKDHLD